MRDENDGDVVVAAGQYFCRFAALGRERAEPFSLAFVLAALTGLHQRIRLSTRGTKRGLVLGSEQERRGGFPPLVAFFVRPFGHPPTVRGCGWLRSRTRRPASSSGGAHARKARPIFQNARLAPWHIRGIRRALRRTGRLASRRGCCRPSPGRMPLDPSARTMPVLAMTPVRRQTSEAALGQLPGFQPRVPP